MWRRRPLRPQLSPMYPQHHSATNACYNCGKPGHISKDCTEPKQESNRAPRQHNNHNQRSDMKCYNCGGYGHMARDCTKGKISDYPAQERPERQERQERQGGQKCFNCGKEGHFSRECNARREYREREPRQNSSECYHCHEVGHFARDCPSNQSFIQIKRDWYSLICQTLFIMNGPIEQFELQKGSNFALFSSAKVLLADDK